MASRPNWQKSSYSGEASNCVELAHSPQGGDVVLVRESDDSGVVLASTRGRMARLLAAARAGKLDPPRA